MMTQTERLIGEIREKCRAIAEPLRYLKGVGGTLPDLPGDIVLLEAGTVDVGDLARTAFLLDMDTKPLCSEDCKGLCPRCGADLNLGPCSCGKETDPRLAVLAKLLENRENE